MCQLCDRLRSNQWEIAGLADFPTDSGWWSDATRETRSACRRSNTPQDCDLARVMFVMLRVAQEGYGESGYYPALRQAIQADLVGTEQVNLGEHFQIGLRRFGFPLPRHSGHRWVTPVLIHAGVPRCGMHSLIRTVAATADIYEDGTLFLDSTDIASLAERAHLHINIRRLLQSGMRGVRELWSALAEVVLPWRNGDDHEDALANLPPGLDAEALNAALIELAPRSRHRSEREVRVAAPWVTYDPEFGAVRLIVPTGRPEEWKMSPGLDSVVWDVTPHGWTAELLAPPPNVLTVTPADGLPARERTFMFCRPEEWDAPIASFPGMWFRESSRRLESGIEISISGPEPGEWYVVARGEPGPGTKASRVPLAGWPASAGYKAWLVTVPEPAAGCELVWFNETGNAVRLRIASHGRPRIEVLSSPTAVGEAASTGRMPVFAEAPRIRTHATAVGGLLLRRASCSGPPAVLTFQPTGPETRLPAGQGIWQLREAGGRRRALLDFAVIPGLRSGDSQYVNDFDRVEWELAAPPNSGSPTGTPESTAERRTPERCESRPALSVWRISASTVEPNLTVEWRWPEGCDAPRLVLTRPVHGLRWRTVDPAAASRWTRDTIRLAPASDVVRRGHLEVQTPMGEPLLMNGAEVRVYHGTEDLGAASVPLAAYAPANGILLERASCRCEAVVISDRPLLESMTLERYGHEVVVSWLPPTVGERTVLLAWDTLSPASQPRRITLSDRARHDGNWIGRCDDLHDARCISITLATRTGGLGATYLPAVDRAGRAVCAALHSDGHEWAESLHQVQVGLLSERGHSATSVGDVLQALPSESRPSWREQIRFTRQLEAGGGTLSAVPAVVRQDAAASTRRAMQRPDALMRLLDELYSRTDPARRREAYCEALHEGIHPGWMHPMWSAIGQRAQIEHLPQPLDYFADLWWVSNRAPSLAAETNALPDVWRLSAAHVVGRQRSAAERIADFHRRHCLPWPGDFLPWRAGAVTTRAVVGGHGHKIEPRPVAHSDKKSDIWLIEAGLDLDEDLYIEGVDEAGRQVTLCGLPTKDGRRWSMEARVQGRHSLCCESNDAGITVPCWTTERLLEVLKPTEVLRNWVVEPATRTAGSLPVLPAEVDAWLMAQPVTGAFVRPILEPPHMVRMEIKGGGQVLVASEKPVPTCVTAAFRLAWIDRLAAVMRRQPVFGSGGLPLSQVEFCRLLAQTLSDRTRSELITRCLAFSEIVLRCLLTGGLGVAVRPADPVGGNVR